MTEPTPQDDLDRARFLKEKQEYLDARAAYDQMLGQVSSSMPLPYSMQSNYGTVTDGPQRASSDPWIREKHPDLAAAGARVVKEQQDYLALDEPVSSHAQPECSIAKYTSEKLYEYYAMAEMIYKLATDETFRKQVAEKIGYFLTHGAIGNYLTANRLLDLADPLYRQMPDFLDYWLADDAGDAALDKRKEELQTQIDKLESLATVYRDQSFKQMGDYFKSMWEKFTKRFSECGILYGISTVAVDGAFLVAEIGAGLAFLKGVKIVARALPSGKMIAELISVNGKSLGQASWSKEALAAKYGEPDKIHVGGREPDANRPIPDRSAEDMLREKREREAAEQRARREDEGPDGSYRDRNDPEGVRRAPDGEAMVRDKNGNWKRISEADNNTKGRFGEMMADDWAAKQDPPWAKVNGPNNTMDTLGHQGLDSVYRNPTPPPDYFVTDAKYGTAGLSTLKSGQKQMSPAWIEERVMRAFDRRMADRILENHEAGILRVDKNGNVTWESLSNRVWRDEDQ